MLSTEKFPESFVSAELRANIKMEFINNLLKLDIFEEFIRKFAFFSVKMCGGGGDLKSYIETSNKTTTIMLTTFCQLLFDRIKKRSAMLNDTTIKIKAEEWMQQDNDFNYRIPISRMFYIVKLDQELTKNITLFKRYANINVVRKTLDELEFHHVSKRVFYLYHNYVEELLPLQPINRVAKLNLENFEYFFVNEFNLWLSNHNKSINMF